MLKKAESGKVLCSSKEQKLRISLEDKKKKEKTKAVEKKWKQELVFIFWVALQN